MFNEMKSKMKLRYWNKLCSDVTGNHTLLDPIVRDRTSSLLALACLTEENVSWPRTFVHWRLYMFAWLVEENMSSRYVQLTTEDLYIFDCLIACRECPAHVHLVHWRLHFCLIGWRECVQDMQNCSLTICLYLLDWLKMFKIRYAIYWRLYIIAWLIEANEFKIC